ncbi:MAG TPA: hypothetical protein VG815_00060, partial [Chloroflexota bacterium]|nr:hypothetical protein [Chloroflexota bacterium]
VQKLRPSSPVPLLPAGDQAVSLEPREVLPGPGNRDADLTGKLLRAGLAITFEPLQDDAPAFRNAGYCAPQCRDHDSV